MKKTILILGHNGMLGHMVKKYFDTLENHYNVQTIDGYFPEKEFLDKILNTNCDVIVNCIGKIPQKKPNNYETYLINVTLPIWLAENKKDALIIHPSTDCVFSGKTTAKCYYISDRMDASDAYGTSKRHVSEILSLYSNVREIRTSIIGPELKNKTSLFEWVLNKSENEEILGYNNHCWNGITTLEWGKFLHEILQTDLNEKLYIVGSDANSKYDILIKICNTFNIKRNIKKHDTKDGLVNKCLYPYYRRINLEEQLVELKSFYYE